MESEARYLFPLNFSFLLYKMKMINQHLVIGLFLGLDELSTCIAHFRLAQHPGHRRASGCISHLLSFLQSYPAEVRLTSPEGSALTGDPYL